VHQKDPSRHRHPSPIAIKNLPPPHHRLSIAFAIHNSLAVESNPISIDNIIGSIIISIPISHRLSSIAYATEPP